MIARKRPGVTSVKTAMTAKTGHGGGGGGRGRTGGGGRGHESERAGSADVLLRMDLDDFFGVIPFAGPSQTLGDLMSIDEPLTEAAVEANELWLRTDHHDLFYKETDRLSVVAAEFLDRPQEGSNGRRLRSSSGSSRRNSSHSNTTTTSGNNNIDANNTNSSGNSKYHKSNAPGGLDKENEGGLHHQERRDGVGVRGGQMRDNALPNGGVNGAEVGEDETRARPMKRRRENGGVLASTCSSAANKRGKVAISAPKSAQEGQDPMKKRLLEFRQKNSAGEAAGARGGTVGDKLASNVARTSGRGLSSRSTASRSDVTQSDVTRSGVSRSAASRSDAARSGVTRRSDARNGVSRDAVSRNNNVSRNNVSRSAVLKSAGSRSDASREANTSGALVGTRGGTGTVSGGGGETSAAAPTCGGTSTRSSTMVSKPVTMVKRRVGGANAAAVAAKSRNRASAGAQRGAPEAGPAGGAGGGRLGSTRGGGVLDGKRRLAKGGRETAQQGGGDSSALSFDDALKAKLEAHNKVVNKGKHTYEPAASVRDCRMWEKKTGKKYGSLSYDERADANKEIDDMRAGIKERQEGRS